MIRLTVLPAVMVLMGRHAWFLPARLDKALPDVDIEGDKLDVPDWPLVRTG